MSAKCTKKKKKKKNTGALGVIFASKKGSIDKQMKLVDTLECSTGIVRVWDIIIGVILVLITWSLHVTPGNYMTWDWRLLRVRTFSHKTFRVYHVCCNSILFILFYMSRITVIYGILKEGSLLIGIFAYQYFLATGTSSKMASTFC